MKKNHLLLARMANNQNSTLSSKKRLAQIIGILKKHHLTQGIDPVKFREILEDLGPTFVKIGQIMSSRQDMFSERYCKELVKLRDNVAPMPFSVVEQNMGLVVLRYFHRWIQSRLGVLLSHKYIKQH